MGMVKSKRKKPRAGASSGAVRRIVVDFPAPLLSRAESAVAELATNRSAFIRAAVEQYIEMRQREKLERELAEGYAANASQARSVCEDFAHSDSEIA